MATVYRALQPSLGRFVAVKVLRLGQLPDPTLPERFRREARMAANLLHPNIVPVYDFGEWQGYLFIVMTLVAGGTLKERLQGPLPAESAVRLVGQVANALGYAHAQGVVHRDVKPTNILLAPDDWAMLGDFGIARALGETTRLTSPYGTIGTPAYMAPEQWVGGEIDGRADLYSLGIVLFEMLAGSPPFTATTSEGLMRQHLEMPIPPLKTLRPGLSPGFEDVLACALAKAPADRYRHAGEFKAALEAAAEQLQTPEFFSGTRVTTLPGASETTPDLGPTMRIEPLRANQRADSPPQSTSMNRLLLMLVLILLVLLAGAIGFIASGGQFRGAVARLPVTESMSTPAAVQPATSGPPVLPAATRAPEAENPAPTSVPTTPIATVAPPPTASSVPPTLPAKPAPVHPVVTPVNPSNTASDPRMARVERHISDYFAALNDRDYARAQAVCCTPGWRSRYPLDEWQKNFAGVTGLRFATEIRYTLVETSRIVAEVDYSFTNNSGARRFFTLRWTFVPSAGDWLADDAVAFPQS